MDNIPVDESSHPLRVGLTYNLKKNASENVAENEAPDMEAEYDSMETVLAIKNALESDDCRIELLEATEDLPLKLAKHDIDIVFNIAEGIQGRGREAEIPAIMNFYKIPYTGSDETTLCLALDKALTKRVLETYQIRTPKYFVISKDETKFNDSFTFPAIVKPNAEGSSKGISDVAIVSNPSELKSLISKNISLYHQDMLVEEYIGGREFTVGILGNGSELRVFPPMEIVYLDQQTPFNIYSYNVKQNYKELIRYECPAAISKEIETEMVQTAKKIYEVLQCKDFARIDFRLSQREIPRSENPQTRNSNSEKIYFIEINPLPGLAPGYSDFPMIAEFNGMNYNTLVRSILNSALKRHGFHFYLS
ncbi:D-alanine--D-alanine ligase family protein [Anaerocolumna sp.]|uniref:D-alanine--D-alanine ligase family protein n=1 Tax=Anaerocolumna sp. TaxID=2041569 RepID=UPI0028AF456F|nr:ATP-grasp domain-containing protein [Anaerocolumna sp.]